MVIEGVLRDNGGAVYNVGHSAYGAKPSSPKTGTGGTTTKNSDVLTAAANTFAADDVGKHVWVPDGDEMMVNNVAVAVPMHRIIKAYVSPTQVTLDAPATGSTSGQNFGFDWDATKAIQLAIDTAYNAGGGRVLLPPGQVYSVMAIGLRPGVTLDLNGSTLKRFPLAALRTLSVPEGTADPALSQYRWGGAVDSPVVGVCNGVVDGNRLMQGPYTDYQRQQDHLLFFDGAGLRDGTLENKVLPGRLRVTLENLVLQDSVADGIQIYRNVDASITNVRAMDCWRGGLVAGGGYSRIRVDRFMAGGVDHDSGIDLEVDGDDPARGYGGSQALEAQLDNIWLQGDFDVELRPGGILIADNVICSKPGFILGGLGSTVRVSNSEFVVGTFAGPGTNGNRIVFPHDMTLSDCTFTVQPERLDAATAFNLAALRVAFRAGLTPSDQRLRVIDCKFKLGPGVKASDNTFGIWVEEDALSLNNELVVQGCEIPSGFDVGIRAHFGLRATVAGTRVRAAKPFQWDANEGDAGIDLTIDDVDVRGAGFYMASGNGYPATSGKRIEHRNTYVDEADAGLTAAGGFNSINFVGGRVIRVTTSPVGRAVPLLGMPGDVAELETPVPGQTWRWVCTSTDSLGTAPVWKPEAALGA